MNIINKERIVLMSLGIILIGLLFVFDCSAIAQQDFQEWVDQRQSEFRTFHEERDRKFHQFLQKRWEKMKVFRGTREDTAPKPEKMPVSSNGVHETRVIANVEAADTYNKGIGLNNKKATSQSDSDTETDELSQGTDTFPSPDTNQVQFLGHDLRIQSPDGLTSIQVDRVSSDQVAQFWNRFARLPLGRISDQLRYYRNQLNLDGWGYLRLVHSVSTTINDDDPKSMLMMWALLLKTGADVRMAHDGKEFYLLFHSPRSLMGTSYFQLDGKRFYLFSPNRESPSITKLKTYQDQYSGHREPLRPNLKTIPRLNSDFTSREFSFTYEGEEYSISTRVDRRMVKYFDSMPQMELKNYFKALTSAGLDESFLRQLKSITAEMDDREAVGFLLRFVQKGFDYKTDQNQFGEERYLLPVQSVYHPYTDCDDRSLLYAWLVREVLNKRVIGLDYPGHVATAVQYDRPLDGVYIEVDNEPFIVADPTYINSNPGEVMPKYQGKSPSVLFL